MSCTDRYGLPLTTSSDRAAALYREGVDLLLSAWPGAAETLDQSIAVDPDFALAHAARARLHAIRAEPTLARERIGMARTLVVRNGTEREKSHVAVLAHAIEGRAKEALGATLAHCENWPRDAMILSLPLGAFGLFAFSGMADHDQARVDFCTKHARHFDDDDWWFVSNHGWALVEYGDLVAGRRLAERGLDLRRANAHAAHGLAHAMFEDGSGAEAEAFISDWLPGYDRSGFLHSHIAWHQALIALESGDVSRAMTLYDDHIRPHRTIAAAINVVSDGASFLWRLRAYGHQVPPNRWDEVATYADTAFPKASLAFIDLHMALLAIATGKTDALDARLAAITTRADAGTSLTGTLVPDLSRALRTFADEDFAGCIGTMEPIAADVVRIGGSRAQREIVEDTLLIALMRAGEATKARALLDTRLHRRPSPRDSLWRQSLGA